MNPFHLIKRNLRLNLLPLMLAISLVGVACGDDESTVSLPQPTPDSTPTIFPGSGQGFPEVVITAPAPDPTTGRIVVAAGDRIVARAFISAPLGVLAPIIVDVSGPITETFELNPSDIGCPPTFSQANTICDTVLSLAIPNATGFYTLTLIVFDLQGFNDFDTVEIEVVEAS
jgi:hypothetical protein